MLLQTCKIINHAIISGWNSFWFKPMSTRPLALFRILLGLLLIQYALLLIPDFFIWFGKDGIVAADTINSWEPFIRFNILNFLPNNDLWLVTIFTVFIVAAVCLTLGFLTRISSIIVFFYLISFHARDYLIINSGDNFMRLLCFWLMFSPAGLSLSLDHWLKKKKESQDKKEADPKVAPWAQRLMQINMSLLYAQAFLKKITGITWQNGSAVYFSSRMVEMHRFSINYIFDHLWTCKLLTWATLGIEFSLCTLIWIKPLRYYVIAAGIMMHLMIDWTMNIPQFEWIMIFTYVLFIEPSDLNALIAFNYRDGFSQLIKKFQFH